MDDTISRQAAIDALDCINGVEEVLRSLPSAQSEPCGDAVSRQAAIDAVDDIHQEHLYKQIGDRDTYSPYNEGWSDACNRIDAVLNTLPSAQPDGISLEWIDKHLEWLDNCDNDFAQLAKVGIRAMVDLWKKDRT